MSGLDTGTQEAVIGILGDIPYTSSTAVLNDLATNSKTETVRRRQSGLWPKLGTKGNSSVSGEYLGLAEQYYAGESLTPFRRTSTRSSGHTTPKAA